MLFAFLQGLLSRCIASISTLFGVLTSGTPSIKPPPDAECGIKGDAQAEPEQDVTVSKRAKQKFMGSLSRDAIRKLASRYNEHKPCEIFGEDNGSFNACFFVLFPDDGARWVVRVPIETAFQQPWEKLQSEVATVNYLRSATKIPVPRIHAYGRGEILTNDKTTTQMFLISDYIHGKPVMPLELAQSEKEIRSRLLQNILDILLELRSVEFDTIGSLMPGKSDEEPVVGNLLTFAANEIPGARLPTFATGQEYMQSQFDMVLQHTAMPCQGLEERTARYELFAAHSLQKYFTVPDAVNNGPFVLHHPDLLLRNIIVNDDMEIQGIIDWEFTNVIPLPLFVPPLWAISSGALASQFYSEIIYAILTGDRYQTLRKAWDRSNSDILATMYIAQIMRHPTDVVSVFRRFFAQTLFGNDVDKAESDFFEANEALAAEARRRAMINATIARPI
ncbi:hypothetical protein MY11210_008733 [Beauveria gryllotalpidicola]